MGAAEKESRKKKSFFQKKTKEGPRWKTLRPVHEKALEMGGAKDKPTGPVMKKVAAFPGEWSFLEESKGF